MKEASRQAFYTIAQRLAGHDSQCVILGCAEIGMLMQQEGTDLPLFDTTVLHVQRITQLCYEEE